MDLIQLVQGDTTIVLHGSEVSGAVRGARLLPACSPEEAVNEEVEVVLEGSAAEIETALEAIGRLVDRSRAAAAGPGGAWGYLAVRPAPGGAIWRSKILSGWPAYSQSGAGGRARGSQGLKLTLVRENWWEGAESAVPLSNPHGAGVTGGLTLYNHLDAAHANYADIAAGAISGDLPAPATVELVTATQETGTVWGGLNVESDPANLNTGVEGETGVNGSGVTGAVLASPAYASGGQYQRFSWTGSSAMTVCRWTLTGLNLTRMGGRPFRPLLRFFDPPEEPIRLWWRVSHTGMFTETLWEGTGKEIDTAASLQDFPALFLPPWAAAPGLTAPPLNLELAAQAVGAGGHSIEVDAVTLLPLDGWRKYSPLMNSLAGLALRDDCARDLVQSPTFAQQAFAPEGPGYWLPPGRAARLYFLIGQRTLATVGLTSTLKVSYRPRRKGL